MSYDREQSIDNPVAQGQADPDGSTEADGAPEGLAGSADPGKRFREMEVSEEEQREIAAERERRLDPANRPDNAEVDNTHRTFEDGEFKD
ncbi:hypothetical protein [Nocardioides rubriscoriae]|uniref:hypothetical protein n=1 Tax=Nocardioides rubriscoriae TaxID=642762 RepID=UPI0011DF69D6|nr:hypothetical protein [Nocardioides rubriscoriae]